MQAIITKNAQQIANNAIVGIEDAILRKRLYIYSLIIESLSEFFEGEGYFSSTKESLYKNRVISNNIDIADFTLNKARIDVRIMDNLSPDIIIPKSHRQLGIEPDFYFVVKIDEYLEHIFFEGFIPTDSLVFDRKIQDFYVLNSSKLINFERLKQVISFAPPKSYSTHFEEEELFRLYLKLKENNLDIDGQKLLLQGLLTTTSFIKKLNTAQKTDNLAQNLKLMPTLLEEIIPQLTENIIKKQEQALDELKKENKEEPTEEHKETPEHPLIEEQDYTETTSNENLDRLNEQEHTYQQYIEEPIYEQIEDNDYFDDDIEMPDEPIEIYEEEPYNIKQNEIDEALAGLTSSKEEDMYFEDDYIPKIEPVAEVQSYTPQKNKVKKSAKPLFLHLLIIFILGSLFLSFGLFKKPKDTTDQKAPESYNAITPSLVEISDISWGIEENLTQNTAFIDYLNMTGKTIETELSEALPTISKQPKAKDMQISIIFDNMGIFKNIMTKKSSGSKELDKKACDIIKEILESEPPEGIDINTRYVRSILLINFNET